MMDTVIVLTASLFAGFVDAVVGGGGLILVPTLFSVFPSTPPPTLFGTNKGASMWGSAFASWQYSRHVQLRWVSLWPAVVACFIFSFLGAWAVTFVSPFYLRKALPWILIALLVYTLIKKDLGQNHAPKLNKRKEILVCIGIGAVLGFYDGFFGPGVGSLMVFLLVRILGYDFLNASAHAKVMNTMTNIAAVLLFMVKGHVWWHLALPMAVANIAGSFMGSRMALKQGSGFVRAMFMVIVSLLILKSLWDAYLK